LIDEKNKKTKIIETKETVFGEAIVCLRDLIQLGKS
jgi:hypothetical protein